MAPKNFKLLYLNGETSLRVNGRIDRESQMDRLDLRGIVTPLLTPFNADGTIAETLYHEHATRCLDDGAHFLSPFGTTGEAASVPIAERRTALENLVASNAASAHRLLPGTGLTSLVDTMALTAHAVEVGVAGVMVLPPYFVADATDAGLYRYVAQLIEGLADNRLRIILYNIPKYTGASFSPTLTRKLSIDFPGVIVGYKDSSGQWLNTAQVIRAAPDISVFPGAETMLPQAMATGGAGCISASCNVNVTEIRRLFDLLDSGDHAGAKDLSLEVNHVRKALENGGLIQNSKAVIAARTKEPGWLRCLPPLQDAAAELSPELQALVSS